MHPSETLLVCLLVISSALELSFTNPLQWRHNGHDASQIMSLTVVYQSFIQAQIKENIKAPRHWPLCGEFTGDLWIPRAKGQ